MFRPTPPPRPVPGWVGAGPPPGGPGVGGHQFASAGGVAGEETGREGERRGGVPDHEGESQVVGKEEEDTSAEKEETGRAGERRGGVPDHEREPQVVGKEKEDTSAEKEETGREGERRGGVPDHEGESQVVGKEEEDTSAEKEHWRESGPETAVGPHVEGLGEGHTDFGPLPTRDPSTESSNSQTVASGEQDPHLKTTTVHNSLQREGGRSDHSSTMAGEREPVSVKETVGGWEEPDGAAISLALEPMTGASGEENGGGEDGKVEGLPHLRRQESADRRWYLTFEQFVSGIQQEPELCQFFAEQSIIDLHGTSVDPVLSSYTRTVLASNS